MKAQISKLLLRQSNATQFGYQNWVLVCFDALTVIRTIAVVLIAVLLYFRL